jgi:hypothetical protein
VRRWVPNCLASSPMLAKLTPPILNHAHAADLFLAKS